MRVNIYAEEMTDRIEIIEKTTKDGRFTGLRIYFELPVTVQVCTHCKAIYDASTPPICRHSGGAHDYRPMNVDGPFMHHPGDDDSSAVTFWGKRDLRFVLEKAWKKLNEHYGVGEVYLVLPESDRQLVLLALAVLSLESPGFDTALNTVAMHIDNVKDGRAEVYDRFREARAKPLPVEFTMGDSVIREMAVELPRKGRLAVTVCTGDRTLHKDETKFVAEQLREIADVYANMSTPEDDH